MQSRSRIIGNCYKCMKQPRSTSETMPLGWIYGLRGNCLRLRQSKLSRRRGTSVKWWQLIVIKKFWNWTTHQERREVTEKRFIYLHKKICAAKRIDTELCSSNISFGAPEEGDEEALKEFREVMRGEIQAGQLVDISTTEVLSATKDPPAWWVHQITDWYK